MNRISLKRLQRQEQDRNTFLEYKLHCLNSRRKRSNLLFCFVRLSPTSRGAVETVAMETQSVFSCTTWYGWRAGVLHGKVNTSNSISTRAIILRGT